MLLSWTVQSFSCKGQLISLGQKLSLYVRVHHICHHGQAMRYLAWDADFVLREPHPKWHPNVEVMNTTINGKLGWDGCGLCQADLCGLPEAPHCHCCCQLESHWMIIMSVLVVLCMKFHMNRLRITQRRSGSNRQSKACKFFSGHPVLSVWR